MGLRWREPAGLIKRLAKHESTRGTEFPTSRVRSILGGLEIGMTTR